MINNEGVLLPIGTIVVLKDGYKKLMIIGRMQLQGKEEKLWDYLGILYPEGYLGEDYTFLFNNEDIEEVVFEGYTDLEDEAFKVALKKLLPLILLVTKYANPNATILANNTEIRAYNIVLPKEIQNSTSLNNME